MPHPSPSPQMFDQAGFLAQFRDVIIVTAAYFGLYYAFVVNTLLAKKASGLLDKKEKTDSSKPEPNRYTSTDPIILRADRTMLNMLEQMPPFLVGLWLYALCVDVPMAAIAGWAYIGARAFYPFLFKVNSRGIIHPRLLLSTLPGYIVITFFFTGVVKKALSA